LKQSCSFLHTCLNTLPLFLCSEEIMNQHKLTNCMDFLMSAKENSTLKCGSILPIALIACLSVHLLTIRYCVCMEDCRLIWQKWRKFNLFTGRLKYHQLGFYVIFYGRILFRIRKDGLITMREESVSFLGLMCWKAF
jgi:hypothetical protein